MFAKFFDTTPVNTFTDQIVKELVKALPPARIGDESRRAAKQRDQMDERLRRQVDLLARSARLNIYQKAKIGSMLQDALEAAGYPAEFSKVLSYEVVKRVAQVGALRG